MKTPRARTVLLICDMLNTMEFPEARQLRPHALKAAQAIARLKRRLKKKKTPVIYVNDNFGRWHSDWKAIYELCSRDGCLGKEIAETVRPDEDDYFILKPKHSGFYQTSLENLLAELGARTLIITGIAGNICVLFTAHDAHMREFEVIVPADGTASNTPADNAFALRQLKKNFGMSIAGSAALNPSAAPRRPAASARAGRG